MTRPPIPSTALILRRRDQVFLVQRHPGSRFMGRFHTFVGGKVDESDRSLGVDRVPAGVDPAHLVSCLRETFEETGWLALPGAPGPLDLHDARRQLLEGTLTFGDLLAELDLTPDGGSIRTAGRWITPTFQAIRFESFYFITDVPENVEFTVHDREHIEGLWIPPRDALERWDNGRLTLPPPVVHSLRMLRDHAGEGQTLHAALNRPPQIYGKPGKRIEFRGGIQLVPLFSDTLPPATHTNCYLVGRDEFVIIDPATTRDEDRTLLSDYLEHLADDGMVPRAIVLTHQHHDHVSAARWLHETRGLPVMASAVTRDLLAGTCPVHDIIADGDVLELAGGWELEAIHTPGHAPGHLCFLERKTKTLIAGDMISGHGTILISPTDGGDMIAYLDSLRRLIDDYEYDLILPAHGGSIGAAKDKLQELIDHRLWRENKLLDIAAGGVGSLKELVSKTYDDVRDEALPYAHLSTLSILDKLEREGRPVTLA